MVVAAATETAAAEVASLAIGAAMLSPSRGVDPPDRQAARGGALPEHLAGCVRTRASATTTVSTASGGVDMCARQHAGVAKTLLRQGRGPAGARRGRPPGRPVRPRGARGHAGPGGRLPDAGASRSRKLLPLQNFIAWSDEVSGDVCPVVWCRSTGATAYELRRLPLLAASLLGSGRPHTAYTHKKPPSANSSRVSRPARSRYYWADRLRCIRQDVSQQATARQAVRQRAPHPQPQTP